MTTTTTYKYMNIEEAAEHTGYKVSTIYQFTHKNAIPYMGGDRRKLEFDPAELYAWRQLGRTKEAAEAIMKDRELKLRKKYNLSTRGL